MSFSHNNPPKCRQSPQFFKAIHLVNSPMAAVRDSLSNLGQFQIPRPKCVGMEFVTIRGSRSGFYRSINKSVALKYGLVQQKNAVKRPTIPENWFGEDAKGEEAEGRRASTTGSIPEEPELEPTPDYEEAGAEEKNGSAKSSTDRIAVPNGQAPPAPPLLPELRQSLLQPNRSAPHQNGLIALAGKKTSEFDLMAAEGHKFMGTFCPSSGMAEKNGLGKAMASIRL